MSNPYDGMFKDMEATMLNHLKNIDKEVDTVDVEKTKELTKKYNVNSEDNLCEKDLAIKYKTFCDELHEHVKNKKEEIDDIKKSNKILSKFSSNNLTTSIVIKKKLNANQNIDCNNKIVERAMELETTIYNNKMKELGNMKVKRYDVEKHIIKDSMNKLKEWSNKNTCDVIFDSKVDEDDNKLYNRVLNKTNLYFLFI